MKFKVGDKVKILPSAVGIGVLEEAIGKAGIITDCSYLGRYIRVYMDNVCSIKGYRRDWAVNESDIAPVIVVGQQLLFDFMR